MPSMALLIPPPEIGRLTLRLFDVADPDDLFSLQGDRPVLAAGRRVLAVLPGPVARG